MQSRVRKDAHPASVPGLPTALPLGNCWTKAGGRTEMLFSPDLPGACQHRTPHSWGPAPRIRETSVFCPCFWPGTQRGLSTGQWWAVPWEGATACTSCPKPPVPPAQGSQTRTYTSHLLTYGGNFLTMSPLYAKLGSDKEWGLLNGGQPIPGSQWSAGDQAPGCPCRGFAPQGPRSGASAAGSSSEPRGTGDAPKCFGTAVLTLSCLWNSVMGVSCAYGSQVL